MKRLVPLLLCVALSGCAVSSSQELAGVFDQGVAAYDAGDYPRAYKIWSSISDQDVAAMRNAAMMLRAGQGVAKNPQAAAVLYRRAADAGLPNAQADLADMLLKGELGPPDAKAALPLLQSAAAAGHPIAEYELAQLYESGTAVPRDLDKARLLYTQAASHGMAQAQNRLAQIGGLPRAAPATSPPSRP